MPAFLLFLAWYSYRSVFVMERVYTAPKPLVCGPPIAGGGSEPLCSNWSRRILFDTLGVVAGGLALMGWLHNRTLKYSPYRSVEFDGWYFKLCGVGFIVAMTGLVALS